MSEQRNRVIEGMQEWKQKEQMIADLFSLSASRSRYVQKLKLDHLFELRHKLGNSLTKDERIVMRILRGEIAQMERQLYPNLLLRLIVKLVGAVDQLRKNSLKKEQQEIPGWKLKVVQDVPKQKQQVKLQQKATLRPVLIQKKKQSQRKSLGIKR